MTVVFDRMRNFENIRAAGRSPELELFASVLVVAQKGNPTAENLVGILSWDGLGTLRDLAKARQWLERTAFDGDERVFQERAGASEPVDLTSRLTASAMTSLLHFLYSESE